MELFAILLILFIFGCLIHGSSLLSPQKPHLRKELLTDSELPVYQFINKIAGEAGFQVQVKHTLGELTKPREDLGNGERMQMFKRMSDKVIDFVVINKKADVMLLIMLVPESPNQEQAEAQKKLAEYISGQTDYSLMYLSNTPADYAALEEILHSMK